MKPFVDDQDDRGILPVARRAGIVAVSFALLLGTVAAECTPERKPDTQVEPVATTGPKIEPGVEPNAEIDEKELIRAREREATFERERVRIVDDLPFEPVNRGPFFPDMQRRLCVAADPLGTIDVHRSLFVHDQATLAGDTFSLQRTLQQLAQQITSAGVAGVTAERLFRELWDTQNPAASPPEGTHCNANGSTINGFPNSCPRVEGAEASNPAANLAQYVPVALVNRFDLAHEGWRNCGEHRIIYARTGAAGRARNFIIFEAVLPNPSPGCKDACRPVAEFWAGLSTDDDPASRATKLETFYYAGLPGFRPVVHVDHYSSTGASSGYGTAGGGQIRTNQFLQDPWTLKEFRTLIDCAGRSCEFQFVPDTVKLNPFSRLWSPSLPTTDFGGRVGQFRAAISLQVDALGAGTSAANLSYVLANGFNGAQSDAQNNAISGTNPTQGDTAYCTVFGCSSNAAQYLQTALDAFNGPPSPDDLTARQIVNRATALSCGGCHEPSTFGLTVSGALGPTALGLSSWPLSAGFTHVNEQSLVPLPNPAVFGGQPGFAISPALTSSFLPARQSFLEAFLAEDDCVCTPRKRPPFDRVQIDPRVLDRVLRTVTLPERAIDAESSLRLHALDRALEKVFQAAVTEAGGKPAPILHPTTAARTETLKVTERLTQPEEKALARTKAILDGLAETPPRRTVTGSFRVH